MHQWLFFLVPNCIHLSLYTPKTCVRKNVAQGSNIVYSTCVSQFNLSLVHSQLPQQLVPTIGDVEVLALTLDTVCVVITVSNDGGQPVLEYTVSLMYML